MILPRLYSAETTDFSNNGLGTISDAIDCKVTQGYGSSVLEMKYPTSGKLFAEMQAMRIIYAQPCPGKEPQPYSIYKMKKISDGVLYIYARHICYNLDGWIIPPMESFSLPDALKKISENVKQVESFSGMSELQKKKNRFNFVFETDSERIRKFSLKAPTDIWSAIGKMPGSLLEVFGTEVEFDGYSVRFLERLGSDKGVSVKYGKNLISLEQEENFSQTYSGIVGYYYDGSQCALYTAIAPGKHPVARFLPVDLTEPAGNVLGLPDAAEKYVRNNDIGHPVVSLTVKMSSIEAGKTNREYSELEVVSLGDTVHVYFPLLDVSSSARVSKTVYDCLRGRYDIIEIGSTKKTAADVIENQQRQIDRLKN